MINYIDIIECRPIDICDEDCSIDPVFFISFSQTVQPRLTEAEKSVSKRFLLSKIAKANIQVIWWLRIQIYLIYQQN